MRKTTTLRAELKKVSDACDGDAELLGILAKVYIELPKGALDFEAPVAPWWKELWWDVLGFYESWARTLRAAFLFWKKD